MSQLKIDQAFITAWKTTNSEFGLPTAYENKHYKPTQDAAYAEIFMLPNDSEALSLADSDETSGIFRVILRYPVGKGAFAAKNKAQEIINAFPIGTGVPYSGQSAIITKTSRQKGVNEDGWYKIVVSIQYFAIITRV